MLCTSVLPGEVYAFLATALPRQPQTELLFWRWEIELLFPTDPVDLLGMAGYDQHGRQSPVVQQLDVDRVGLASTDRKIDFTVIQ